MANASNDFRAERKLVGSETQSVLRGTLFQSINFKEDVPGLDTRNVKFDAPLSGTHRHLCGFPGNRLIGENANPDFSSALETVRHRPTSGLDLTA